MAGGVIACDDGGVTGYLLLVTRDKPPFAEASGDKPPFAEALGDKPPRHADARHPSAEGNLDSNGMRVSSHILPQRGT